MKKVCYYLGAGASYPTLPIVSEIPARIISFVQVLQETEVDAESFAISQNETLYESILKDEILAGYANLLTDIHRHDTIDTFAKMLYLTDKMQYLKLKALITIFFIYEQSKHPSQNRYDAFFAAILNESYANLPNNVRIVSWNYDYQLEKAYSSFSKNHFLSTNQSFLNVCSPGVRPLNEDGFMVFKVNGTTGLYNAKQGKRRHDVDVMNESGPEVLKRLFLMYGLIVHAHKEIDSLLSFAWEAPLRQIEPTLSVSLKDTYSIVVIGYSFPFFNRQIDRTILHAMRDAKKIYIQDPNSDEIIDSLTSALPEEWNGKIEIKKSLNRFYLPREF